MRHGLILFFVATALMAKSWAAEDWVVLKTDANGKTTVSGNAALADQKFTPASTFKVMIAWAALEEGLVTPATKHLIKDGYVPGTPREVDLHEALYFSSNDYFDWLGKKLGREKLEKYIAISGYAGGKPPKGWLDNMDLVERGGTLTITPRENHEFMWKLADAKFIKSADALSGLLQVLDWPKTKANSRLFGKTGTAGGAVWFNGFRSVGLDHRVVTVFAKGGVERRVEVIKKFYSEFDEKFDEAWLKEYPFEK